jgi:RNA polymerase sigma-70 factor (ECF subfamily)
MVSYRIDPRLALRVDPSDIVQEALADAACQLSNYLRHRGVPFYPWLRSLAWERLIQAHRRHVLAEKRSITREQPLEMALSEESVLLLAERLNAPGTPILDELVTLMAQIV